jgi:hypothetical protein
VGATGANGANGSGFTFIGPWLSGQSYAINDIVSDGNGSSYVALGGIPNSVTDPAGDGAHWALVAAAGAPGAAGPAGAAGPVGQTGPAGATGPQGPAGVGITLSTSNTAAGVNAMPATDDYAGNSAFGASALNANATNLGNYANSAFGAGALANANATFNSAFGSMTLGANTTGGANSAFGAQSMSANTIGSSNTALGADSLEAVTTGNQNIGIGIDAGQYLTTGSHNIYVGAVAADPAETNVIRIGTSQAAVFSTSGTYTPATQTYIAGISGTLVQNGAGVVVDSDGHLGVVSSSRRYKEAIEPMADASDRLLQLRPVKFRYRQPDAKGDKPVQYGLIAEEVAEAFPELVVVNPEGQPETVAYHLLPALLLNEWQKEHRASQRAQAELAAQRKVVVALRAKAAELDQVKAKLERLEAVTTQLTTAMHSNSTPAVTLARQ